jgi:hypothetical protein
MRTFRSRNQLVSLVVRERSRAAFITRSVSEENRPRSRFLKLRPVAAASATGCKILVLSATGPGSQQVEQFPRHHRSLLRGPMFEYQSASGAKPIAPSQLACVERCFARIRRGSPNRAPRGQAAVVARMRLRSRFWLPNIAPRSKLPWWRVRNAQLLKA